MLAQELQQGAATVESVAAHFEQLKLRALELKDAFNASQRGFFTPTEDEQTRHLQVSYFQSRNALVELVTSFHDASQFESAQRPLVLAVAYAGALVLVDAARFLRDHFHAMPVVRKKLNEPEPHFGIPEGTYHAIQKSLTNPLHVWHLYHAHKFVEQNWVQLEQAASGMADLAAMLGTIQRLQDRMDVSTRRYLLARTRARARSLRNRLGRDLFWQGLYGLQKSVSRLVSEKYMKLGHQPGLPVEIDRQLQSHLRPGDVIVTRKEHALTNYFLPGYWPHAALFVGSTADLQKLQLDDHEKVQSHWPDLTDVDALDGRRVLEALKDGVRVRSLACPFASDAIALIRPQLELPLIAKAIGRGFHHAGKPYDFDFDFTRADRLVCTEVVYRSYEGIGPMSFSLKPRAGRMTLSAEDLLSQAVEGQCFDIQAVYCPKVDPKVLVGDRATDAIRATVGG